MKRQPEIPETLPALRTRWKRFSPVDVDESKSMRIFGVHKPMAAAYLVQASGESELIAKGPLMFFLTGVEHTSLLPAENYSADHLQKYGASTAYMCRRQILYIREFTERGKLVGRYVLRANSTAPTYFTSVNGKGWRELEFRLKSKQQRVVLLHDSEYH